MAAIPSPVLGVPLGGIIPIGAAERFLNVGLSRALDQMECHEKGTLRVPLLEKGWSEVRQVPLGPSKVSGLVKTARTFLTIASRIGRLKGIAQEATNPPDPKFDRPPELYGHSGTPHWYVQCRQDEDSPGAVFLNSDGRAVHFHRIGGKGVTLGYGNHLRGMHYISVDQKNSEGISVGLFTRDEIPPDHISSPWIQRFVVSLAAFYRCPINRLTLSVAGKSSEMVSIRENSSTWSEGVLKMLQDSDSCTLKIWMAQVNPSSSREPDREPETQIIYEKRDESYGLLYRGYRPRRKGFLSGFTPEIQQRLVVKPPASSDPSKPSPRTPS